MAGLIDGSAVPPLMVYSSDSLSPLRKCFFEGGLVDPTEIVITHPISDIQALHGIRSPGPATSQKDFVLAFVAESNDPPSIQAKSLRKRTTSG